MKLLDAARGAYVRSPVLVRRGLAPLLGLLPSSAKFGRTYQDWRKKITRAEADPALAASGHRQALRELILAARMRSPFYRDLLMGALGADFDYSNFAPEYLPALPILNKHQLEAAGEAALIAPLSRLEAADTSGSNGERPFRFYLDRDRSPREMAFVHHAWAQVGFNADLAKVTLRGFGLDASGRHPIRWDPALKELQLSVFPMTPDDVIQYVRAIDERGIEYLYGYPSAMELFCRHLEALKLRPKRRFKALLPISEPVYRHQREVLLQVLGPVPIQGFYGLSEKAAFAIERPDAPDTYDFSPLYGATELVDAEGQAITEPGREGRLIGTGFLSTGMPFIRYDTEDLAELVAPATPENGYRLSVRNILPRRKPNFLIASDGNRVVTIDFTPDNPRYFTGIAEYQFLQTEKGKATIRYIPTADGVPEDARRVAEGLTRRTHGRIVFDTEAVTQLAGGRAGKRAFIDQRLDLSRY